MPLTLPAIAFAVPVPPTVWRGESGFSHDAGTSAAAVLRYEQAERGEGLGLSDEFIEELENFPASSLLWVTFKRYHAARYGKPERIEIDKLAYIIAEDGAGGFLILFCSESTEDSAMANPIDDLREEIKKEARGYTPEEAAAVVDRARNLDAELRATENSDTPVEILQTANQISAPEPDEQEEERRKGRGGGGDIPNPGNMQSALNIRPDVVATPAGLETITTMKSTEYKAAPEYNQKIDDHRRGQAFLDRLDAAIEAGDERFKYLGSFKEALGESHPDVSGEDHPAALGRDIRTASGFMKWDYQDIIHALLTPEDRASSLVPQTEALPQELSYEDRMQARAAAFDEEKAPTSANRPMTVEAISKNPWNAVDLSLPENADAGLLNAAHFAASYCADSEMRFHEAARANMATPIGEIGLIEPQLSANEESHKDRYNRAVNRLELIEYRQNPSPFVTHEAIAVDPWNAVALPLAPNADADLLDTAKSAAEFCADREHGLMEAARAGDYTPPGWTPGPESPDVHEENEAFYLEALDRLDEIDGRQNPEKFEKLYVNETSDHSADVYTLKPGGFIYNFDIDVDGRGVTVTEDKEFFREQAKSVRFSFDDYKDAEPYPHQLGEGRETLEAPRITIAQPDPESAQYGAHMEPHALDYVHFNIEREGGDFALTLGLHEDGIGVSFDQGGLGAFERFYFDEARALTPAERDASAEAVQQRDAAESSKRQTAELDASSTGLTAEQPDSSSMSYEEKMMARAAAFDEAKAEAEVMHEAGHDTGLSMSRGRD